MAVARPILGLLSLLILAAGVLFQIFIILAGIVNVTPFNNTYFLQAAAGTRNPSRWTYWSICGVVNGVNGNCGAVVPALPFDPPGKDNFDTTTGVPAAFIGTNSYYLMSRFMWVFFLIALFFAAISLFTGVLALCTRIGAYLSGLNTMIALIFQTLAAALMTATYVKGRNVFLANGQDASLGKYAFGFMWASVAAYFLCTVFFCSGGRASKDKTPKTTTGKKSYFGRNQSTRSRGSFIDSESQRRVKEEYE